MANDRGDLEVSVGKFDYWHYEFELGDVRTPIANRGNINRTRQRRRYFFDALLQVCGGDLRGKRVLDLGCNAGFWSLAAAESDAAFVLGIEGRQAAVDQARLVFTERGIERSRWQFERGDVFDFDYDSMGPFDVVLCLGLLYHVSKPVELLERIAQVNSDLLVVDTELSLARGERIDIRRERLDVPRNAIDHEIVFFPSRRCLVSLIRQFDYDVQVLRPTFTDDERMDDYIDGRRRAFLCAKSTDLSSLVRDSEEPPHLARVRSRMRRIARSSSGQIGKLVTRSKPLPVN